MSGELSWCEELRELAVRARGVLGRMEGDGSYLVRMSMRRAVAELEAGRRWAEWMEDEAAAARAARKAAREAAREVNSQVDPAA